MGEPLARDMDLIRDLLLRIERGERSFNTVAEEIAEALGIDGGMPAREAAGLENHLHLLEDAGFVKFQKDLSGCWYAERITWDGHEFLMTIRDNEVWRKTKDAASKVGGASVAFLWEIAKAEVKTKLGLQ